MNLILAIFIGIFNILINVPERKAAGEYKHTDTIFSR